MKASWDIFCTVVDNYGDIGVTWRLARQLVAEHGLAVRLWVDDLNAFVPLCPAADANAEQQWHEGVDVRHWPAAWPATTPAEVVIGAFACQLPPAYIEAMSAQATPPLWLNLEYLSAEDWVEGCHGLPSPQPNGLRKVFFFPGFTARTGGLLREAGLLASRDSLQSAPKQRAEFLAGLGVQVASGSRLLSLFAYENRQLGSWLQALAAGAQATHLLVPQGRILADLAAWLEVATLAPGALHQRGALTVQVVPFVSQGDYDKLLWACDFNAVRGEDSFVRAQWAGVPMLWHIYVQDENAHWEKLEAFLALYRQGLSDPASVALTALWRAWNIDGDMGQAWQALQPYWDELQTHAREWAVAQAAQPDLATALVHFCRNSL
ncbi:elongation factor P maturation arginine rhamnosyltransferase EarP [Pseudomonas sp. S07E 245]|uniref:elongation factor P maturation arginine rhamnosyltransferase EarP n=1 Tax=Pseudomonas sp. S07E 245 TaxID=2866278 RepID=UPI001C72F5D9|nr:elongation factor P maturation arginine rhamnosyltransferase EarP [Pseudomonas sp. S07E 245]QYX50526.1 elongation factor P maturation arginine rhamnosyltransferase EarP [Pseudomonas sp. S07E 245]